MTYKEINNDPHNYHQSDRHADGCIPSSERAKVYDDDDFSREHNRSNRWSPGRGRDRSREEKQIDARYEYEEDMAKFNRIIDSRKRSLENSFKRSPEASPEASPDGNPFLDNTYLSMLNSQPENR